MKDEHARDEPVKDAAQDVTQDVTQDVAEDVSSAAEDGSVRCSLWHAPSFTAPHAFLGRHVKDEHVKDAAQEIAEGVAEGVP